MPGMRPQTVMTAAAGAVAVAALAAGTAYLLKRRTS
jgi:hypothetical protein